MNSFFLQCRPWQDAIEKGWERRSFVVECLTRDWGAVGSSLTGLTMLCLWARNINSSLVLVQPRKTLPYITERLLMGRKESNQTNKQSTEKGISSGFSFLCYRVRKSTCVYNFLNILHNFFLFLKLCRTWSAGFWWLHIDNEITPLFVFCLIWLCPSQQYFSHVGTGLSGLNQY